MNQREVGADTYSFSNALKHVLRQDPDVILVRRCGTSRPSPRPSRPRRHLVFATLHTQDAPRPSTASSTPSRPPAAADPGAAVYHAAGRDHPAAAPTWDGQARVAATEVMVTTPAIRNLIREAKVHRSTRRCRPAPGTCGPWTRHWRIWWSATITMELARQRCHDPQELERLAGAASGGRWVNG